MPCGVGGAGAWRSVAEAATATPGPLHAGLWKSNRVLAGCSSSVCASGTVRPDVRPNRRCAGLGLVPLALGHQQSNCPPAPR